MSKQEAFLANEDMGDSLDSVEALIKKHEDFEKSLAAQEEKIKALDEFASKLIENEHYAADEVHHRRDAVSKSNLASRYMFVYCLSNLELLELFDQICISLLFIFSLLTL